MLISNSYSPTYMDIICPIPYAISFPVKPHSAGDQLFRCHNPELFRNLLSMHYFAAKALNKPTTKPARLAKAPATFNTRLDFEMRLLIADADDFWITPKMNEVRGCLFGSRPMRRNSVHAVTVARLGKGHAHDSNN